MSPSCADFFGDGGRRWWRNAQSAGVEPLAERLKKCQQMLADAGVHPLLGIVQLFRDIPSSFVQMTSLQELEDPGALQARFDVR